MGPILALKLFFTRGLNVTGRSRRSEYVWVTLFHTALLILIGFVVYKVGSEGAVAEFEDLNMLGKGVISVFSIYWFITLIPWVTLSIRRFHDLGHTGWLVLLFFGLGFIPLLGMLGAIAQFCWLFFRSGHAGTNSYGHDPRHGFRYVFD